MTSRHLVGTVMVMLAFSAESPAAQPPADEPAYVVRGRQTEANRQALRDELTLLRAALAETFKRHAPDRLPKLDPVAPAIFGYGILPRVRPDGPPPPPRKPSVVRYSWSWSDRQIGETRARIELLSAELARLAASAASHETYAALDAEYRKVVNARRLIDADVDYNWLWQKQIAANRALFDRLMQQLEGALARQTRGEPMQKEGDATLVGFDTPRFLRIEPSTGRERVFSLPLYTDIEDPAIVLAVTEAIETHWQVRDAGNAFRVQLQVTVISPERLYCGPQSDRPAMASACSPPARGERIDLGKHVSRFPKDGAVLTTGAAAIQIVAGAIVLSPHDTTPRELAHEFGHILGFPDLYLRGYKDLGAEGFEILELVPDATDLMAAPRIGSVTARHFRGLVVAREISLLMQAGVAALYGRNDAFDAVAKFREILEKNPSHYGATLQLAKALDRTGKPDEALPIWNRMVEMADAARDTETATVARARIGRVSR